MHSREECAHAETSIKVLRDSVLLQGPACLNDIAATAVASSCSTDGAFSDCILIATGTSRAEVPQPRTDDMRTSQLHADSQPSKEVVIVSVLPMYL